MKFISKVLIALFLMSFSICYATFQKDIVRIAISNQNFSTIKHEIVEFTSNDEMFITSLTEDKHFTTKKESTIKIELKNNKFEIHENGLHIITLESPISITSKNEIGIVNLNRKGTPAIYYPQFELKKIDENKFYIINIVDIENYLRGVVPNEMPISFGLEALKAQTVAARNYVVKSLNPKGNYDVTDTTSYQVYYGKNSHRDISDDAIRKTKGIFALYNSELILTPYFSTSIGITDSWEDVFGEFNKNQPASIPYLKGVYDTKEIKPFKSEKDFEDFIINPPQTFDEKSPKYRWKVVFTEKELEDVLNKTLVEASKQKLCTPEFNTNDKIGKIKEIKVLKRTKSGKAILVEIKGEENTYTIKKELMIRKLFKKNGTSLYSANFIIDKTKGENGNFSIFDNSKEDEHNFIITGGGFGHNVGMSQFGASYMAKMNYKYDEILKHYYNDIILGSKKVEVKYNNGSYNYELEFYHDTDNKIHLKVDNIKRLSKVHFYVNNYEFDVDLNLFSARTILFDITDYVKKGDNKITFKPLTKQDELKDATFWIEVVE